MNRRENAALINGLWLGALSMAFVGCSDGGGTNSGGAGGTAGATNATASTATASTATTSTGPSGGCNNLAIAGVPVQAMQVAADAPTPVGGTLQSGTYILTSDVLYKGAGGPTGPFGLLEQHVIQIDTVNHTIQFVDKYGTDAEVRGTLSYSTSTTPSSTLIETTGTCPPQSGMPLSILDGYDATPTTFVTHFGGALATFEIM